MIAQAMRGVRRGQSHEVLRSVSPNCIKCFNAPMFGHRTCW